MYVLTFFVPPDHAEDVLEALFAVGAGRIGDYERCSFSVRGEGRFRPRTGASPFLGVPGRDERVPEDRVELVLADDLVDPVLSTLRAVHPYEEPAVYLVRLDDRCAVKPTAH